MSDQRSDEPIDDAPEPASEQEAPAEERLPPTDQPTPSQAEGGDEEVDEALAEQRDPSGQDRDS